MRVTCFLPSPRKQPHEAQNNNNNNSGRDSPPHNEWERNCRFEVHGVSEPVRHDLITAGVTKGVGAARCHRRRRRRTYVGGRVGEGEGVGVAHPLLATTTLVPRLAPPFACFACLSSSLPCRHFYQLLLLSVFAASASFSFNSLLYLLDKCFTFQSFITFLFIK